MMNQPVRVSAVKRGSHRHRILAVEQMRAVAHNVERSEVWEECGHSVAPEQLQRLALTLREFMLKR